MTRQTSIRKIKSKKCQHKRAHIRSINSETTGSIVLVTQECTNCKMIRTVTNHPKFKTEGKWRVQRQNPQLRGL